MSADNMLNDYHSPGADDSFAASPLPAHAMLNQPADTPGSARKLPRLNTVRWRPPGRSNQTTLSLVIMVLVLVIIGAGGLLFYLDRNFQGKIYPNVAIRGLQVGMLTPQEAEAALRTRYGEFVRQPVTLTFGDRRWTPTLNELGVAFDFGSAAETAYRSGRSNGLIENVRDVATIWQNGLELPLRVSIDQQALQDYVRKATASLEYSAVDATLVRDGAQIRMTPAQNGQQVLVDETVASITEALVRLQPQTTVVHTRALAPRLSDIEAAAAKERLDTMIRAPLSLSAGAKEYVWTQDDLARLIETARVPKDTGSDTIALSVNRAMVAGRVRQIAEASEIEGTRPRVAWNGGNLRIVKPGLPGKRLDETAATEMIVAALGDGGGSRELALPLRTTEPPVTAANLGTLGLAERVSVGRSDFTGSAGYRIHNIGAGMNLLNGLLIAPGEEFSFNNSIGEIDEKNGFVKGYAIIENRTQLEFGGGICQDSTTMFRAAFWAGLPFTEWRGHQFYIKWYDKYAFAEYGNGAGMDATIFTGPGGQDLRFVNDTGRWLLIQATSNPKTGVAEISLYGTKPDRTVEVRRRVYDYKPAIGTPVFVADPKQPRGSIKQTDTARSGMTVDVERIVIENGLRKKPDLFRTRYAPWPNIFAAHPADFGPDGRPHVELLPGYLRPQPPQPDPNATPADPNQAPAPGTVPAPADPNQAPPPANPPTTDAQPQPAPSDQPQPTPAPPSG